MIFSEGENKLGTLLFSHGAGMPMDHPFMDQFSALLVEKGFKVIRFEFPYMQHRRDTGKKLFPNKMEVLKTSFVDAIKSIYDEVIESKLPLYLLGKSLGGRVATIIMDDVSKQFPVGAVFVLGYPFHPIGKPEILRIEHLKNTATKVVLFQGERDKFGSVDEVLNYQSCLDVSLHWLADGDHDLKPRVKSGYCQLDHLKDAVFVMEQYAQSKLVTK